MLADLDITVTVSRMRCLALLVVVVACGSREQPAAPAVEVPIGAAPAIPALPPFDVPEPTDKVIAIGRGEQYACVVRASGGLDCWGRLHAPSGLARFTTPSEPSVRRLLDDAIAIDPTAECVLRRSGEVACLDPVAPKFVTEPLAPRKLTALATSGDCFIVGGGDIQCIDGDPRKLVTVPNIHDAVALAGTNGFVVRTCAVRKTGQVACKKDATSKPWETVAGLAHVERLAFADYNPDGCAIANGGITCFAIVDDGGLKRVDSPTLGFGDLAAFAGATELAMWSVHRGQRYIEHLEAVVHGNVIAIAANEPAAAIAGMSDAVHLVHGCAIRATGAVACWGSNDGGFLAQPTTIGMLGLAPAPVVGLADVVDLAVVTDGGFAVARDGKVYTWSELTGLAAPKQLALPGDRPVELAIDLDARLCVRSDKGRVWCQVGDKADPETALPFVALEVAGAAHVAIQAQYSLRTIDVTLADDRVQRFLLDDGRPHTMLDRGIVERAEHGLTICTRTHDGVTCGARVLPGASAVSVTDPIACAIQRGHVLCAQAINTEPLHEFREVPGIVDATDLVVAQSFACAVYGKGRVGCWDFKQDPDTAMLPPTTRIDHGASHLRIGRFRPHADSHLIAGGASEGGGLHSIGDNQGLAATNEFGCAIMTDRTVQCWGSNLAGEHGDGSLIASPTPIGIRL